MRKAEIERAKKYGIPLVGPKPKCSDPDKMGRDFDDYFDRQDKEGRPYTVIGLALACGLNDRRLLLDYQKRPGSKFQNVITAAKARIEEERMESLVLDEGKNAAGKIFDLQNNFDMRNEVININTTASEYAQLGRDQVLIKMEMLITRAKTSIDQDDSVVGDGQ